MIEMKLKKKLIITVVLLAAAGICAGLMFLTRLDRAAVTKVYTEGIFRYISLPVKWVENLVPAFPVGEVLLAALCIILPAALIVAVVRCFLFRSGKPLARYGLNLVSLASAAVILFVLFGGLNYNALTFAERYDYDLRESTISELSDLCLYLNGQAAERLNKLSRENGVTSSGMSVYEMCEKAADGYKAIEDRFPGLKGYYTTPKPAISSTIMCYFQISGIYPYISPEAIVNARTPEWSLPHTICHEMAHQRGIAREDEANYVAYLAAISNPDVFFQYSGYAEALSYSLNALYSASPEAYAKVIPYIHKGIREDMSASARFWDSFVKKNELPAKISSAVNDTYLKINDIPDGTRSYGRIVDLLLAEYRLARGIN